MIMMALGILVHGTAGFWGGVSQYIRDSKSLYVTK